jgi:cobalamin biosynthesis Mg chelatase CobN
MTHSNTLLAQAPGEPFVESPFGAPNPDIPGTPGTYAEQQQLHSFNSGMTFYALGVGIVIAVIAFGIYWMRRR